MAEGFRVGRITIEGFKGFTTKKEVDLQNRHVFLLGSNGNGKSSVIEAIRWGLFGSTNRPNDIVANRGIRYTMPRRNCSVAGRQGVAPPPDANSRCQWRQRRQAV